MIVDPRLKIRQVRELKNFTQDYIASQLDMSTRAYSKIETGETQLTVNRLNEISEILEVNPLDLLGFEAKNVFNNNTTQEGNVGYTYNQVSGKIVEKYEATIKILERQIELLQGLIRMP